MVQAAEKKASLPQDERARQEMDELRQRLKQAEAKATREGDRADRLEATTRPVRTPECQGISQFSTRSPSVTAVVAIRR